MKILIVDDNADVRAVLKQIVEHHGHDALEAADGVEGLELAARHRPDAIISDGLMPRMDGYQFLRALKQDKTLNLIPFVFFTAIYIGDKEYEFAFSLGADALIIKPKAPDDFWKEFTSALEAHASKKKLAAHALLPERPKTEEEFFRDYCWIVAAKLEEKVWELETVITNHERTKAILLESEAALKAAVVRAEDEKARAESIIEAIGDGITIQDTDFRILYQNQVIKRMVGDHVGELCYMAYEKREQQCEGCPVAKVFEDGGVHATERSAPTDAGLLHVSNTASPLRDSSGKIIAGIEVVHDITESKKNMEALKTYSGELSALTSASNTLMLTTNPLDIYQEICNIIYSVFDLKMVWLGVIGEGSFEVKPVAYAGHEDGYLSSIKVMWDDSQFSAGPIGKAIKTKKLVMININDPAFAMWKAEARKRGYEAVLSVPVLHVLHDRDKCLGALTFYSSDPDYFTLDRIKLCQIFANQSAIAIENARLVSGLEKEVAKRTHALEDINIELQQLNKELLLRREEAEAASKSKTDFLANMSHELRTPLNAIIGFSEILADGIAGPIADNQKELVNDISSSGTHLLELITDILDLSKIEAGKMELEPETFKLKELFDASLIMFKEKALKHGLIVTAEIDDAITSITADKRKLKQVIVNLLSNAFKFTPDGGSVRVAARRVKSSEFGVGSGGVSSESGVRSSESQSINSELIIQDSKLSELRTQYSELNTDLVEISVEDTGIGISEENQQRLFQPFQQIETSLTRKFAGTGLGLSLCRRFVELHNGRIWVESEEGKGSRFAFIIPVRQEDKQVERMRTKGQQ